MLLNVYGKNGSVTGQVELPDEVFNVEPSEHAMYLAVKAYLANQRQGTHKTKVRSEVSGGGRKPWKQKGRGTARSGSNRSPVWVGGGKTDITNLKPICSRCNLSMGSQYSITEWNKIGDTIPHKNSYIKAASAIKNLTVNIPWYKRWYRRCLCY